ncbi:prostaglandin E synthase [Diachasma alloeum]|uniref:prostaglandin E synthase n=1 Tax=Diachasma alloeum TaxID=454923 RepID=UPI0007383391|nr:prostaglandin E synthase [Diachasma alloeum]
MSLNGTYTIPEEFQSLYAWWGSILILEMMVLIWFTGQTRVKTQTIHSEEDRRWLENPNVTLHPNGGGHPSVHRIRSAHFNDLKIILPFLLMTPIWLTTSPHQFIVKWFIRLFSMCKIFDTICCMELIKAPGASTVLLTICYGILCYIGISSWLFYSILQGHSIEEASTLNNVIS